MTRLNLRLLVSCVTGFALGTWAVNFTSKARAADIKATITAPPAVTLDDDNNTGDDVKDGDHKKPKTKHKPGDDDGGNANGGNGKDKDKDKDEA